MGGNCVVHCCVQRRAPSFNRCCLAITIARDLVGLEGVDTGRSAAWVLDKYEATDFIERRYTAGVTLFVARSYDPKRLYHHPELGAAYARSYDTARVVPVSTSSGSIPVHVLTGTGGTACYALLYDGEFIDRPFSFQARQVFSMLVSPRRQMTLFFAHGPAVSDPIGSPIGKILVAAVESFQTQKPTEPR